MQSNHIDEENFINKIIYHYLHVLYNFSWHNNYIL